MTSYGNGHLPNGAVRTDDKTLPIAIVGIGFRGPGDAKDVESFYRLISEAREAWSLVPKQKWNREGFYHPDPDRNGTSNVQGGYFFQQDLSKFDAPFFSMTDAEAASLDPQQRLLLECCYEALENAGIPIEKAIGSNTSVFSGTFGGDYTDTILRDPEKIPLYQTTNSGHSRAIVSNRLSYFFDLKGPSVTIDTACSASLVALHLACQTLRTGEADQAIVTGSSVILSSDLFISMSSMRFLSPDGRCYSFDSRANGYGRGEGVGCIILKPLEDALRDNDTIRAVIRNTGVNQDGRTPGISFPSKDAQERLIKTVYEGAGLDPLETTYVEAHGTGTQVGDPIETSAISSAIAKGREEPLLIGSVKSNVGHMEGASGVTGIIKCVLMLENETILPSRNFQKPNERIPFDKWRLKVATSNQHWHSNNTPRRLSINGFGYGGTNAHAIIEESKAYLTARGVKRSTKRTFSTLIPPALLNGNGPSNGASDSSFSKGETLEYLDKIITNGTFLGANKHPKSHSTAALANGQPDRHINGSNMNNLLEYGGTQIKYLDSHVQRLYILSSFDRNSGKRQAERLRAYLNDRKDLISNSFLENLTYTLNERRSIYSFKTAIRAGSGEQLIEKLSSDIIEFSKSPNKKPVIGFVFTGQGAQWSGMGSELLDVYPVFEKSLRRCGDHLRNLGASWDIVDELRKEPEESRIDLAFLSQPICSAIQIAIVDLLRSWGVLPASVTGHSSGEIAAAYTIGSLSLEDAMSIAYYRGVAASRMIEVGGRKGAMIAVGLSEENVQPYIQDLKNGTATIACINSPSSVTLSGDMSAIDELSEVLEEQKVFARKLLVEVAYHSHHMNQVSEEYLRAISGIKALDNSDVQFFSSVTGREAQSLDLGPSYWVSNLLGQVKFSSSLNQLCYKTRAGGTKRRKVALTPSVNLLIEIGPHSALAGPIKQIIKADSKLQDASIAYSSMLIRNQDAVSTALDVVGKLAIRRYPISFPAINRPKATKIPQVLVDLPPYPWNHSKSYWGESRLSRAYRSRTHPRTDLLGVEDTNSNPLEPRWRNVIRTSEIPWVKDHKIQSNIVYPAAGYIVMAIEAASQRATARSINITGFDLREVTVEQALIIQEEQEGETETMVNLRPYSESTRVASDIWDEFTVYSVANDNRWTLHCRGLIMVRKDNSTERNEFLKLQGNQMSRAATIADFMCECRTEVNVKDLYKQLRTLGIDYGSTFENMVSARTGKDRCIAHVKIPDISAVMPMNFQYPFIIHPSMLDSILHPLFAALSHETGPFQDPMIPTFIQEIYVSSAISKDPGKELTVYASTKNQDLRHVDASMLVMDSDSDEGNLVVDIKGVTCVTLEKNIQPEFGNNVKKIGYNIYWAPDIDLLNCNGLTNLFAETTSEEAIVRYVKLLGHKNPQINILIISKLPDGPSLDTLRALASSDKTYSRFAKCHCTYTTDDELEVFQKRLEDFQDLVSFKKIDLRAALDQQDFQPGSYDLVFASGIPFESMMSLDSIYSLVKTSGRFILTGGAPGNQDPIEVNGFFQEAVLQAGFASEYSAARLLISGKFAEKSKNTTEILIVSEAHECGVSISHLLAGLRELGTSISVTTLSNVEPQGKMCIVLSELSRSVLEVPTSNEFEKIKEIFLTASGVLWITRGATAANPTSNLITGLMRSVRSEDGQIPLVTFDLDGDSLLEDTEAAAKIMDLFRRTFTYEKFAPGLDLEYRERGGFIEIPRIFEDRDLNEFVSSVTTDHRNSRPEAFNQQDRPLRMEIGTPGLLDTIHFVDDESLEKPLAADCVEVEVKAAGLNFRDVMMALGQIKVEEFGGEFSGIVTKLGSSVTGFEVGDRVAASHLGAFCNYARPRACLVQRIPDEMTFEIGATLPVTYCTAYYSLFKVANIQPGESVLVHAASGGLGQAVIELCHTVGIELFVTVSSIEKKQLLLDRFRIPEDHIFSSRDDSFADGIMRITKGKGVDVILNSLAGEALRLTWNCIAPYGRFVELGKRDFFRNTRLEMAKFAKNVSFTAVDLVDLIRQRPETIGVVWAKAMELLRAAAIRPPYPVTVYSVSKIEKALAMMQSGKHMGKLVAVPLPHDLVYVMPPKKRDNLLRSDASYLLVGGLKGLGGAIGRWMISQGAKNLIFVSRSGLTKFEANDTVQALKSEGARVEVFSCDISDAIQLGRLISENSAMMPPIRGVIQGAMVLQDTMFGNMTLENFTGAVRPKHEGTWNLHNILPQDMDFFVMLSSVSGIIGNASQGNYAAGNTFLDAFASYRNRLGLPAVALDLGVILGVGHVAENHELAKGMARQGFEGTTEAELMALIQFAVENPRRDSTMNQVITGLGIWNEGALEAFSSPIFSHFRKIHQESHGGSAGETALVQKIGSALREVKTVEEAAAKICNAMIEKVSTLLMISVETMVASMSLASYGMDSLVAVELRNWIFREMDCTVPILELLANDTLSQLCLKIARRSRLVEDSIPER